jgi:hypothetical protein
VFVKRTRERIEEGDDILGPPAGEIKWKGYFGPYENTKLSVPADGPEDTTYVYNGIFQLWQEL